MSLITQKSLKQKKLNYLKINFTIQQFINTHNTNDNTNN